MKPGGEYQSAAKVERRAARRRAARKHPRRPAHLPGPGGEADPDRPLPPGQGLFHHLCSAPFGLWLRLLRDHGGADRRYLARAAFITLYTMLNGTSRWRASLLYGRPIRRAPIDHPPLFILGHWRSGTTFLHELLSHDPTFAYPTLWQTMAPWSFPTIGYMRPFFGLYLSGRRPMDEVELGLDSPQEEELALAPMGRWSFMHTLYFPRDADRQFRRGVLLEGLSEAELAEWKRNYLWFLKAVTWANGGRPLLLKNPANTGRIATLLEMFPDASFIHIYRNPYDVFASMRHMRLSVPGRARLQETTPGQVERQTLDDYERLMRRYFEQRRLIRPGRLVEVRFEDLEADPMGQVRRVYDRLGLSGYERAAPAIRRWAEGQSGYQKNRHELDEVTVRRVRSRWGFAIERWGYEPPTGG